MSSNFSEIKETNNEFLVRCFYTTDMLSRTPQFLEEREAFKKYTLYLYKEGEKHDVRNILKIEDTILEFRLNHTTDKKEMSTLQAGRDRMESAIGALDNMSSYEKFVGSLKSYGIKTVDARGLPLDGFRTTVPGQITSIDNTNRDNKAQHLKDFNEARIENLRWADRLYRALQHQYMQRFCRDNPEHQLARNYMSKKANQKLLEAVKTKDPQHDPER